MTVILNLAWAAVALPLVGIGAAFLAESPRRAAQAGMAFTTLAFGAAMVLVIFRLTHQVPAYENVQTFWDLQLTPGASGSISLPGEFLLTWGIRVDPLSVVLMATVLFLSLLVQFHALVSARAEEGFRRFFWVANALTFGLLVLINAPTLFQLWLGWEVAAVAAWMMATHVWRRVEVAAAATRSFVVLRVADLCLLLALALTYSRFGVPVSLQTAGNGLTTNDPFSLAALDPLWHRAHAGAILGVGTRTLVVLGVLFTVAAVIRAAVGPLHVWLSGAIDAPAAGLALVALSAPVSAIVLLARVYPELVEAPHLLTVVALTGAAGAVATAVLAVAQRDLFRVGVFAVSSQAGLMLVAAGMGGFSPALFMLLTSSALSVLFFLCAGNIARRYRSRLLSDHGGSWRRMPRTSAGLLVWALGVSGLSLNTYSALSASLRNTTPVGGKTAGIVEAVVVVATLAVSVLTAVYAFRVFLLVTGGDPARRRGFDASRLREAEPVLVRSVLTAVVVAVLATLAGIPAIGPTFSHLVFFGTVRQVLALDGVALLLVAIAGAGGAAIAWALFAPRRQASAARVLAPLRRFDSLVHAPTPSERLAAPIGAAFLTAGAALDAVDGQVLTPVLDATEESTGALSDLVRRLRIGRVGVSLAASMALVAVLVAASIMAITGHFPVTIR